MHPDTPVSVTVYDEDRDPVSNRPRKQQIICQSPLDTLLIAFDDEGAMTLRRVGYAEVIHLYLDADLACALSTAHLTWMQSIEEWQEIEAHRAAQEEIRAHMAEEAVQEGLATEEEAARTGRPPCAFEGCQEEANYHYNGGHFCWEHRPEPTPEPVFDPDRHPSISMVFETPRGHGIFMTNDFE